MLGKVSRLSNYVPNIILVLKLELRIGSCNMPGKVSEEQLLLNEEYSGPLWRCCE